MKNISITIDHPVLLNKLIKAVHKYYPIGFNLRNDLYDGFLEATQIARNKVIQLHENSIPAPRIEFEKQLKAYFNGFVVFNDFHTEYPSFSFSIVLDRNDSIYFEKELLFIVKISLLTNHYTFFYQEYVKHKDVLHSTGHPYNTTIISLKSQVEKNKIANTHQITQMMTNCFPEYEYANHALLFSTMIKYGVLYGEEDAYAKNDNSLYAFLFDNQTYISLLVVE